MSTSSRHPSTRSHTSHTRAILPGGKQHHRMYFTVDFEDWYQGIGFSPDTWGQFEKRIHVGHEKLLRLLEKYRVKATYFMLGKVMDEHPKVVQEIIDAGHEIGCHAYSHPFLYHSTPDEFRKEIDQCRNALRPFGVEYTGFRAPYFSIDYRSMWALDIIKEKGFLYDSSIFPGDTKRTGIKGYRRDAHRLDNGLWEQPIASFKVGGRLDFGVGGAYFRILPYVYFRKKVTELLSRQDCIFFIHPWELDPEHPYLQGLGSRIQYTHYFNLKSTEKKLERLLGDFHFSLLKDTFTSDKSNAEGIMRHEYI